MNSPRASCVASRGSVRQNPHKSTRRPEPTHLQQICIEAVKHQEVLDQGSQDKQVEAQTSNLSSTKDKYQVVLRIECITEHQMKLALGVAHATFVLAAIALFAEFGQKLTMGGQEAPFDVACCG
ncbi:hypothetical protein WJX74_003963 [Apatococcus lobatus]|uniref:Uncharacterized protein n=1 Tax=Apatococcus lobatus TaxID=904363 RepID=A0AAW1PUV2_9CHLO